MSIAWEGWKELLLGTAILGGLAVLAGVWFWPVAIPLAVIWVGLVAFFRDPPRRRDYALGELCAPADGTVTEIAELESYGPITGPAVRIGIFLSILSVHVNRAPCAGRVRSLDRRAGRFLDARHADSGKLNESTTVVLDTTDSLPGPVVVRQVAGRIARRIICHASVGDHWTIGQRFGMIKFGSRTELIVPQLADTRICVSKGDKVRGGLTILARQAVSSLPVECLSGTGAYPNRDRQGAA
jgi:phosphatidylserine decarboxylase